MSPSISFVEFDVFSPVGEMPCLYKVEIKAYGNVRKKKKTRTDSVPIEEKSKEE